MPGFPRHPDLALNIALDMLDLGVKAQEGAPMAAAEDATSDWRVLADRPTPTLKLDDAWRVLTDPDAATAADWRARVAASSRYATRRGATAAQMLRALFPAAH